jgi:starvation-inducible DNA-binding protein
MPATFALGENARKQVAEGLSRVLADSYTLYLKTHNFHWNVEGPHFRTLHLLFEEQYQELAAAVDAIAERVRALGHYAPGSYAQFVRLASIKEEAGVPPAEDMMRILVDDNTAVVRTLRAALPTAQEAGDEASVDLIVGRIAVHEKAAWMLRSLLK